MNNIQKILAGLSTLALSHTVLADASLVKIGGGVRGSTSSATFQNKYINKDGSTYDGDKLELKSSTYNAIFAQVQHGLPYVPNYRLSSYSSDAKFKLFDLTMKLKHTSNELFWRFNFAIIEAQLGFASHNFSLTFGESSSFKKTMTGVATNIIINVPLFPLTPSINFDTGSGGNAKINSIGIDLAWSFAPGVYLNLGTKNYTYIFNNRNVLKSEVNSDRTDDTIKNNTSYVGVSFNLGV